MRIGDVSFRTGVGPATLRAWERRYGVLRPTRTTGGHRVYTEEDVARVRAVAALVDSGVKASEAVHRLSTPPADTSAAADELRQRLWEASDRFDERAAAAALSAAAATLGLLVALDGVIVPTLRRLGAEWRQSPRNIAREHFTSTLVRSHLVELMPTAETGPPSLAFCPEGEHHDIGLLMAALTVATTGRSAIVLGANTPSSSIDLLLRELRPEVVLVGAATRRSVVRFLATWRPLPDCVTVGGGTGFRPGDETRLGGSLHFGPCALLPTAVATALDAKATRASYRRRR